MVEREPPKNVTVRSWTPWPTWHRLPGRHPQLLHSMLGCIQGIINMQPVGQRWCNRCAAVLFCCSCCCSLWSTTRLAATAPRGLAALAGAWCCGGIICWSGVQAVLCCSCCAVLSCVAVAVGLAGSMTCTFQPSLATVAHPRPFVLLNATCCCRWGSPCFVCIFFVLVALCQVVSLMHGLLQ